MDNPYCLNPPYCITLAEYNQACDELKDLRERLASKTQDLQNMELQLDAALDRADWDRDRAKRAERENEYLTHKIAQLRQHLRIVEKTGDASAQKLVLDILDKLK